MAEPADPRHRAVSAGRLERRDGALPVGAPRARARPADRAENRPGAGGNLGAEAVARSAPDGHTWAVVSNSLLTANPHVLARPSIRCAN
ncbi:MAG: tripartite tricarboxylate transporter substrate-binding protein [Acetobacteraceae bacterium]